MLLSMNFRRYDTKWLAYSTTDTGCIYFLFVVFYKGVRGQTELVCSGPQAIFCIYLMSNKQQQKLFIYQFHELAHC